jgi:acetyltransferase-like isoleucine patch superfamily enzyme
MIGLFKWPILLFVRLFKRNIIKSLSVSFYALKGKSIQVERGASIDRYCAVGSYVYIGKNVSITHASIGNYVSIGNNVSIGQGEHLLDTPSTSSHFYSDPWKVLTSGECVIQDDVWIGAGAVILRGVVIGVGAVVGANAVVTGDVAPYDIVVGVPARVLRARFDGVKKKKLIDSRWWDKDIESAKEILKRLE